MMSFTEARRGKFKTLVHPDNSPVTLAFQTTVAAAPKIVSGKTYVSVCLDDRAADQALIYQVDAAIKEHQSDIEYSPILRGAKALVVKVGSKALADPDLAVLDRVEVHMKLGNFGKFGYCWVASNIFRVPL